MLKMKKLLGASNHENDTCKHINCAGSFGPFEQCLSNLVNHTDSFQYASKFLLATVIFLECLVMNLRKMLKQFHDKANLQNQTNHRQAVIPNIQYLGS